MLLNRKRNYALTDTDWQIQREQYIGHSRSLNPEFEGYRRQRQATKRRPLPARVYTLQGSPVGGIGHEPQRVPQGYHQLLVLTGCAWVTYHAEDYLLRSGEKLFFEGDSQNAIVSCIGCDALNFQITG
jgi:hypothetical protein